MNQIEKLKSSLKNLTSLPAMPEIAHQLLTLQLDTEEGEERMIELIEKDPQIYARVVGLANSSAVGSQRQIKGVREAAMLLGMQRLKSVALGIATMSTMLKQPAGRYFSPNDLWVHSMTVSVVMHVIVEAMPRRIRPDEKLVLLAGLLHDIGLAALHYLDFSLSEELHHQVRINPKTPIKQIEMEVLGGITHADLGAILVRHWNLPKEILPVVEQHHAPAMGKESYKNPLIRLVNIAERLMPDFGFAEHTNEPVTEAEWAELCIDAARAEEILELANELSLQVAQLPEKQEEKRRDERHIEPQTLPKHPSQTFFGRVLRWLRSLRISRRIC